MLSPEVKAVVWDAEGAIAGAQAKFRPLTRWLTGMAWGRLVAKLPARPGVLRSPRQVATQVRSIHDAQ
jgi:hypothetical protein